MGSQDERREKDPGLVWDRARPGSRVSESWNSPNSSCLRSIFHVPGTVLGALYIYIDNCFHSILNIKYLYLQITMMQIVPNVYE